MLINFEFSNYRSFKNEEQLSMEALNYSAYKNSLISYKNNRSILPCIAIFGKNAGGKSNVIRALWLSVQFIRNAQRTQTENAPIPVKPFMLDDTSYQKPTSFEYTFIHNEIKYVYGFSATQEKIVREYLEYYPKGQKKKVFERQEQSFSFVQNSEKRRRSLISEAVADNQLYLSVASTMNEPVCRMAMDWFRNYVFFSRDYPDIPKQLLSYAKNDEVIQSIKEYAMNADLGINDMDFEFKEATDLISESIDKIDIPKDKEKIESFINKYGKTPVKSLKKNSGTALDDFLKKIDKSKTILDQDQVKITSFHSGLDAHGQIKQYQLDLEDESDGTRKLMSIAPDLYSVLNKGGLFLVDEIDKETHPLLVKQIVAKFLNPKTNPYNAQIVFTTHDIELLNQEMLRKDEIYFVDKNRKSGVSTLYSAADFHTNTHENLASGYLMGKYGGVPVLNIDEVD